MPVQYSAASHSVSVTPGLRNFRVDQKTHKYLPNEECKENHVGVESGVHPPRIQRQSAVEVTNLELVLELTTTAMPELAGGDWER